MSNHLAKSSIALIFFTLLSKALVVVRDMAMAATLGASSLSDAYITATTILSMVGVAALAALTVAYIPVISGKSEDELNYITNNFMTVLSMLTLLLSIFALFFTKQIVYVFASGFPEDTVIKTVQVVRTVLPFLFLNVALNITIAYLQYKGSFWYQGVSAVIANGIIVFSVLISYANLQILAIGYAVSIIVPAVIGVLLARRCGLALRLNWSVRNLYVRDLCVLSFPIFVSQILIQLNIIVDKNFSSQIGEGIVTSLDYAHKIANLLVGTIVPSIATVLYPKLTKEIAEHQNEAFCDTLTKGLRISAWVSFPMMVGTILLARPIIHVLFLRGNYSLESVDITVEALIFYAIGMLPIGLIYILNNCFFAMKDTKTPLFCGAIAMISNIVLNFVLIESLSYKGLAIATSASNYINVVLYLFGIRKKIGMKWFYKFAISFLKITVASIAMAVPVHILDKLFFQELQMNSLGALISCLVLAAIGFIMYVIVCLVLREESITEFLSLAVHKK